MNEGKGLHGRPVILNLSSACNCNHGVKEVDLADQKKGSYRPDRFMRKINSDDLSGQGD